jgi:hypothetical protein
MATRRGRKAEGNARDAPVVSCWSPPPDQITDTLRAGYRTAELSDSPPRASRYASGAGLPLFPWGALSSPACFGSPTAASLARNSATSALSRPHAAAPASTLLIDWRRSPPRRQARPVHVTSLECSRPPKRCAPRPRSLAPSPSFRTDCLRALAHGSGRSTPSRAASPARQGRHPRLACPLDRVLYAPRCSWRVRGASPRAVEL